MTNNGVPPPEQDMDEHSLREVGQFLATWSAPVPDPLKKAMFIEQLRQTAPRLVPVRPPLHLSFQWMWLILRAQMRLVNPLMWVGSALILTFGTVVTLISTSLSSTGNPAALPILLVAPIVCAIGVAFLYGDEVDPPLELQRSMPVSPRLILLARLVLLYGFNLILASLCSLILALVNTDISLIPLIAAWLAPMTFLTGLAFLMSVLFFDTTVSILICLLAWCLLVYRHIGDLVVAPFTAALPDLLQADVRPLLILLAAAMVVFGLWFSEKRWE
jgi:hypothetical protein